MLKTFIRIFYTLRIFISEKWGIGDFILCNKSLALPKISIIPKLISYGITSESLGGKKILFVNLASKCGYTPQYEELQSLYKKYQHKLMIVGCPSNDFRGQEPGSDIEISEFCRINYGVTFPLLPKNKVIGPDRQPIYQWLSDAEKNGWNAQEPKWNFFKYLLDENGTLIGVFSSAISPLSSKMINIIEYGIK